MITRERFIELAERCFVSKEDYMTKVNIALDSGLIKLEDLPDSYAAVYPLATAIYEKETDWYIPGHSDASWRRSARRLVTKLYKMFTHPIYWNRHFYQQYPNYHG